MPYIPYPFPFYEYPLPIAILAKITKIVSDPIALFTALAAMAAIVAAMAAVNANKPNSREKTDILKCEILNFIQTPIGLQVWVRYAALGKTTPNGMAELLDIERSKQIFPNILRKGIFRKILKSRKYSKYKWRVYIIAAMSELQKEGYENVGIGTASITPADISQWSYEQSVATLSALGIPQEEIDKYLKYNEF